MILCVIFGIAAIICLVISIRHFMEKGFIFNNAYIYASEKEREQMDKKPLYRQSAIVFLMISIVFILEIIMAALKLKWILYVIMGVCLITVIYAVVSSISSVSKK